MRTCHKRMTMNIVLQILLLTSILNGNFVSFSHAIETCSEVIDLDNESGEVASTCEETTNKGKHIPRGGSGSTSDNIFTDSSIPIDPNIPMTPAQYEAALLAKQKMNKKRTKKKRRITNTEHGISNGAVKNLENDSIHSIPQNQQHNNLYFDHLGIPVNAEIPGYGNVEGRREEGVDIWRGLPYAVSFLCSFISTRMLSLMCINNTSTIYFVGTSSGSFEIFTP